MDLSAFIVSVFRRPLATACLRESFLSAYSGETLVIEDDEHLVRLSSTLRVRLIELISVFIVCHRDTNSTILTQTKSAR